jgi:hypothetical protein
MTNGNPVGGAVGFLNSLKKIMRESSPDQVIIAWDGAGGSQKRRQTVKEYKQGRKPLRKNYEIEGMSEQSQKENMVWQQRILMEMLNEMPIIQLVLDKVEADDIIAAVVQSPRYKGWQKVIVSSDKDVIDEYGISPENFVIARAIAGDKSDNLAGIQGAGLKTISKRLAFLCEDKMHTLADVRQFCEDTNAKVKFYSNVVEGWDTVETNYKVMNLTPPSISVQGRHKINYALENFQFELNATGLKKASVSHGFGSYNWTEMLTMFRGMIEKSKQSA